MPTYLLVVCLCLCATLVLGGQLAVNKVIANGKSLPLQVGQPIRLAALDNDVTFLFGPVSADSALYQYQLVGFDRAWQSSLYPQARYTNLTGNDYTLRVRQRVGNEPWSGITNVPVLVERELTEEWWFVPSVIVYIVLLLGAAMYFFLLYSFRQKLKVQAIRYRIAADLHDEVGATLSSIAISTRLVQKKMGDSRPDVRAILDTINADSEETIYTIRDTIWAINPDNDAPEKLFEKMRSFAFQLLTARDMALDYDNQLVATKRLNMSMEQRQNVYLIAKEAINNIAKHSGATKATVRVSHADDGICLLISDNGVGFDAEAGYEGNGLKNFRSRAAASFINLNLTSAPGQGTQLTLHIPEL